MFTAWRLLVQVQYRPPLTLTNQDAMEPSLTWIEELSSLRAAGRACVMVVVSDVRGSVPRDTGARMIVADGELVWGTIGGGNLEHLAIEHASEMLGRGGHNSESCDYPLGEKTGQCCGGTVILFYESFDWARKTIAVFGAGHVGQAAGGLAPYLAARVLLIDSREEKEIRPVLAEKRPFELLCIDAPEAEIDELPTDAMVLIMTHSHDLDFDVLAQALKRGCFPYLGLIGSTRKWSNFKQRLLHRGFTEEQIASVRCPIGLTPTSKEPTAIALSVAAELRHAQP